MSSRNDITGDALISKSNTDKYRDGWDMIFGKDKKKQQEDTTTDYQKNTDNKKGTP